MVRIRMQADAGTVAESQLLLITGLRRGLPPRHVHTLAAFGDIFRAHGLGGLYRGSSATIARASILSGSQLASYDTLKVQLQSELNCQEGPVLHATCACCSGVIAQTAVQPADTLRSHLMSASGGWRAALEHVRSEGPAWLYRGYIAGCCRQGPVMVVQFPIIEQLRMLLGVGTI
eukprot:gnl/TRDRNA2_/TRDRNA2_93662_c0_seq1.p1 gnl/TRDRNA2_/TRDRNA2_93662_c0~~gnl/TRDRNA2_/TRDRNA2_93662_c0_seq1.p1  ORF type:complete len:175 (-),score=20.42 gnl/TRDRNA2_/TRDRNA2_93662_c0_seq1:98-622(-)